MTSPDLNTNDLVIKAQELKEMYLFGQLTLDEMVTGAITLGMDTAEDIHKDIFKDFLVATV